MKTAQKRILIAGAVLVLAAGAVAALLFCSGFLKAVTLSLPADEISKITRSRTVYGYQELERIKKPLTIILFKHNVSVTKTLTAKNLTDNEILNGPPQSITEITHEKYQKLIDIGAIDGRFTIN